jgi:hypothetical protein
VKQDRIRSPSVCGSQKLGGFQDQGRGLMYAHLRFSLFVLADKFANRKTTQTGEVTLEGTSPSAFNRRLIIFHWSNKACEENLGVY